MHKKALNRMIERHYTLDIHRPEVLIMDFIIVLNKEIEELKKKVYNLEKQKDI